MKIEMNNRDPNADYFKKKEYQAIDEKYDEIFALLAESVVTDGTMVKRLVQKHMLHEDITWIF